MAVPGIRCAGPSRPLWLTAMCRPSRAKGCGIFSSPPYRRPSPSAALSPSKNLPCGTISPPKQKSSVLRSLPQIKRFPAGSELYYLQRLHYLDGKALILNHNYFLKSIAQGLTPKIAEQSIYAYLEQVLHVAIVTSKRTMTVEKMTEIDGKYLDLGDCNCLAVVSSQTYNGDGVMFEYTQSRHRPDYFCFRDNATRHP